MSKTHMGSSVDAFLKEEGIFEETQAQAIKEVVAWQLAEAMKQKNISKNKMATLLKTSRTQVDRLLDPKNDITLASLQTGRRNGRAPRERRVGVGALMNQQVSGHPWPVYRFSRPRTASTRLSSLARQARLSRCSCRRSPAGLGWRGATPWSLRSSSPGTPRRFWFRRHRQSQ